MDIIGIKELITQRFDDMINRVDQRFDSMDSRVDDLTAQVTLTNGRLRAAERDIAVLRDRLYLSAGAIIVAAVGFVVSLFVK